MRLPRDLSGPDLVRALRTLAAILGNIAQHFEISRDDLVSRLFDPK